MITNAKLKQRLDKEIADSYLYYLKMASTFRKTYKNDIDDPRDIVNEVIMYIYELDDDSIAEKIDYIDMYIIQMLKFSIFSPTSKYQHKYNKVKYVKLSEFVSESVDDYEEILNQKNEVEEIIYIINNTLENDCTWYEREVFKRYHNENLTFKSMSEQTGIPQTSLHLTYTKVKNLIINNIKNERKS